MADPFEGMTPIQKIKAIQANPSLNLQNTNGLAYPQSTVQSIVDNSSGLFNNGQSYTGPHLISYDQSVQSGPMSYLGDTWDKISGGANSLGGWFKDTFGPTKVDRSYANYLSSLPHQAVSADQASTINGLYKDGMTPEQLDVANNKALDIYNSNPTDKAMTANEFATNANKEQELNNQQWGYGAQAGLGLGNLGLGVMSYLDKSAYNDKAMNLMDQQLANNNDLMSTRKARVADISKAFGSGSAQTI